MCLILLDQRKLLQAFRSNATIGQVKFLDERRDLRAGNCLQDGREALVMNTIAVFHRQIVSKIQTCQRWMLVDEIENLLLEPATIDAVVLQRESDQALVVDYAVE